MTGRKVIFRCYTGSRLYGTSRPESDTDFTGVFLPSTDDLLGLQSCPGELSEGVKLSAGPRNEAGDVDSKLYSLQKFINLAGQGQPKMIEMLFAPDSLCVPVSDTELYTDEWRQIKENLSAFLSKKSIGPFVGFALSQAHKSTLKGEHLNQIRDIVRWASGLSAAELNEPLRSYMIPDVDGDGNESPDNWRFFSMRTKAVSDWEVELRKNEHGFGCLIIAGRQYDPGAKVKFTIQKLNQLLDKYGSRSEAAAKAGLDYKSLMHAYRLIGQAEELMKTGEITLPRPPEEVKLLLGIRNMEMPKDFDWFGDITSRIDRLRTLEASSPLPKEPKWDRLGCLCSDILHKHINGEKK